MIVGKITSKHLWPTSLNMGICPTSKDHWDRSLTHYDSCQKDKVNGWAMNLSLLFPKASHPVVANYASVGTP